MPPLARRYAALANGKIVANRSPENSQSVSPLFTPLRGRVRPHQGYKVSYVLVVVVVVVVVLVLVAVVPCQILLVVKNVDDDCIMRDVVVACKSKNTGVHIRFEQRQGRTSSKNTAI